jgi:hypothetical protein
MVRLKLGASALVAIKTRAAAIKIKAPFDRELVGLVVFAVLILFSL